MLDLVFADRHVSRLVDQDVRGLEHRIVHEPHIDVAAVLPRFVLELGHPLEFPDWRYAVEDPGKLRVLRNVGLNNDAALVGREAGSNEHEGGLEATRLHLLQRVLHGNCMVIHDAEDAVVFVRQLDPLPDRPHIIPEVNFPRWLYSAENPFHALLRKKLF